MVLIDMFLSLLPIINKAVIYSYFFLLIRKEL